MDSVAIREQLKEETREFNDINRRWDLMIRSLNETKVCRDSISACFFYLFIFFFKAGEQDRSSLR